MGKWQVWYDGLIESRRYRELDSSVYYEKHHILPRCMGGTDEPSNLIHLTPREHFLAHVLLVKSTSGVHHYKMKFALNMMMVASPDHGAVRHIPNSRTYQFVRACLSEAWSEAKRGQPAWNKGIAQSEKVKQAVSAANTGREPWNKGKQRSEADRQKMKDGWARKKAAGYSPWNKKVKTDG